MILGRRRRCKPEHRSPPPKKKNSIANARGQRPMLGRSQSFSVHVYPEPQAPRCVMTCSGVLLGIDPSSRGLSSESQAHRSLGGLTRLPPAHDALPPTLVRMPGRPEARRGGLPSAHFRKVWPCSVARHPGVPGIGWRWPHPCAKPPEPCVI